MSDLHRAIAGPRFTARIALFYAGFCMAIGVQMPFFPVYLAAKGLDARMIGLVVATPMLVRIVAVPLVTRLADAIGALRGALVVLSIASVAGYTLVALAEGAPAILIAFAIASVAATPLMSLADAYALRGLGAQAGSYGPVRLWGSAAFILGNLGTGLVIGAIASGHLVWLIVAAYGVTVVAAFALTPVDHADIHPHQPTSSPRSLLRAPAVVAVLAAAALVQGSHAAYYGFSSLQWQALGLDSVTIGALWSIGVAVEIALFALAGRLPAAFTPIVLIVIGAGGAIVRWTAMALDPPAAALVPLQALHALSFAATHLGAVVFLARAAPVGRAATVQGYLGTAMGAVMALAVVAAGVLYEASAGSAYAAMAAMALIGGSFALAARRLAQDGS